MKVSCDSCVAVVINGVACHEDRCGGVFTFTSRGRSYSKWLVWSLDVWGNKRDGFEVNDRSKRGFIIAEEFADDRKIIRALKRGGFLYNRSHYSSFSIDGDDRSLHIYWTKTDEPLLQLERE